jgi:hypothetical protein
MGNNSDLYPQWFAAREVLLHRRDPYSAEVTAEIQTAFYGRPLDPLNSSDPADKEAFVYPLYVVFLLAPTVTLSFATVAELFRWFLLFAIAASVPVWMRVVGCKLEILPVISGMLLSVSSSAAINEYHQQNLTALTVLLLAGAVAAAAGKWFSLSGLLLALATIKPQLSALVISYMLLWAVSHWALGKRLIGSFAAGLGILWAGSEGISPHWKRGFVIALREYLRYGRDPSILQVLFPAAAADLATAALLVALVLVCWKARNAPVGSEDFGWALAWVVTVTLAIVPKTAAYNQLLLIPALLLLLAQYQKVSQAGRFPRALVKAVLLCLLWEWATALVLALASIFIPATKLAFVAHVPEYTSVALTPISLLAVIFGTVATRRKAGRISPA